MIKNYWLCHGTEDKWLGTISTSKWGVKELAKNGKISSPARDWERVQVGDMVIFLMSDKLCGFANVTYKMINEGILIWPDEIKIGKEIYNRRFSVNFIARCDEKNKGILAQDFVPPGRAGLTPLSVMEANQLISRMEKIWISYSH